MASHCSVEFPTHSGDDQIHSGRCKHSGSTKSVIIGIFIASQCPVKCKWAYCQELTVLLPTPLRPTTPILSRGPNSNLKTKQENAGHSGSSNAADCWMLYDKSLSGAVDQSLSAEVLFTKGCKEGVLLKGGGAVRGQESGSHLCAKHPLS